MGSRRILLAGSTSPELIEFSLRERGFEVVKIRDVTSQDVPCDLLVADLREGLEVLRGFRASGGRMPAILVSSHPPSLEEREEILRLGAMHLSRPFEEYTLFEKVCEALP